MSMLARIVYIGMKPCRCARAHQTQNSVGFSPWKWGILIALFSQQKHGEDNILRAIMHLR